MFYYYLFGDSRCSIIYFTSLYRSDLLDGFLRDLFLLDIFVKNALGVIEGSKKNKKQEIIFHSKHPV